MKKLDWQRYQRHIILDGFEIRGQNALSQARILCVGAGGLGCPILLYLAASGINHIGIIDHDIISRSNLPRQILYTEQDLGKKKAVVAKKKLQAYNSALSIEISTSILTDNNVKELIKGYDIVIDCTDNFATRLTIGDATYLQNIILIRGAILQYEGQVAIFNYKNSICHRCLFQDLPTNINTKISAENLGILNTLCALTGSIIVSEVIKIITGIGPVSSNQLIHINALTPSIQAIKINKNPNCQLCSSGI